MLGAPSGARNQLRCVRQTDRHRDGVPRGRCPKLGFAVGTLIAERPPHRSVRAEFPHTAPTLGE